MNLYLIRHGAYVFNDNLTPYDHGLTESGIKQTEQLRDRLLKTGEIKADVVVSSTMPRAIQTAQILAPAFGLEIGQDAEVEEWRSFNEATRQLNLGEELAKVPNDQRTFYSPGPGCETYAEFIFRVCTALNRLITKNPDKNIVIVCHGGIVEAAFHLFFGFSPFEPTPVTMFLDPDYTSITHWRRYGTKWMLCSYNDKAHL
jgi:probable phosphoglycerate mutase